MSSFKNNVLREAGTNKSLSVSTYQAVFIILNIKSHSIVPF
ncbi:hypothetical protein LDVICp020 [lymphocystis disease virus-China]|uniref:Uncharacterized protein n=1 Tax=lymphocystis disease virus-China TaxID=256729 RepID=Q678I9_9VIRU|nr:hypothetical protein LDVICp020 [lymphocystis disease virus-China]AAU10868.1 hypothetical protein [lymphocystis disease virus-China]